MRMQQNRNRSDLGQQNRRLVLAEILYNGPIARAKIAAKIGLTAASVSRITRDLIAAGLIEEGERFSENQRVGRKFIGLRICPGGCFVTGIAINAFRQDIVVADLANNVIASEQLHFDDLSDAEQVIDDCASALKRLVSQTGIDRDRLVGCGVAITGAVDPVANILRSAPPLNWGKTDVGRIVEQHLDCPVYMDNVPNAKNITAHCFGPTRNSDNILLFNASLAIGCSLMLEGQIYRGADYQGGLIDSMMIPDLENHRLLPVDQIAGGYAVIKSSDVETQAFQLERIIAAAEQDDAAAAMALGSAGTALAYVVKNAYSLLHPQSVIVSGPLLESSHYENALRSALDSSMEAEMVESTIIFSPMTSQQAAQSLAIYQSLNQTDLAILRAFQQLAS